MEQGIGIDSVHVNDVALDVARSDAIGAGQDALLGVPLQVQFQGRRNGDRRQINLSIFAQRPFRQFISVYDQVVGFGNVGYIAVGSVYFIGNILEFRKIFYPVPGQSLLDLSYTQRLPAVAIGIDIIRHSMVRIDIDD